MKHEFNYEFIYELINELMLYLNTNDYDVLIDWLEMQELATQGGWSVFERCYMESVGGDFLEKEKSMTWEDFDEFVFAFSKQLCIMIMNKDDYVLK